MPGKRKKSEVKKAKEEGEKMLKEKVNTPVPLLNPKTILKFCFLCMPELHKLIPSGSQRRLKCVRIYCKLFYGNFKLFIARHEVTRNPLD